MYDPEKRLKWDKSVKNMKIIEGDYPNNYVLHTTMHSPVFFISERDVADKRIEFFYNGIYYNFSSSVPDGLVKVDDKIIRSKTWINLYIMAEDNEFFYFMSFNQNDIKMKLPDTFFSALLPTKITGFYNSLIETINSEEKPM